MSIRSAPGRAQPGYPHSDERIQREHELNRALEAARSLQARLEMLGDRAGDVRVIRSLRDSLTRDLAAIDVHENTVTMKRFLEDTDYNPSNEERFRTIDDNDGGRPER